MEFVDVLTLATDVIGIFGIVVIIWGVILSFSRFVYLEFNSLKDHKRCMKRESLRQQLGSYLLLGLEFLIAADIINTITHPTFEDIAFLGSIVIIRTLISYFLDHEMGDYMNHTA